MSAWTDQPDSPGRWLVKSDDGSIFEAEVREHCGILEAIAHGFNYDWYPVFFSGFARMKWTPDLSHT